MSATAMIAASGLVDASALVTSLGTPNDPGGAVRVFGVTLVGVSTTTGVKLLFSGVLVLLVMGLQRLAKMALRRVLGGQVADPRRFWARQALQVIATVVLVLGLISI